MWKKILSFAFVAMIFANISSAFAADEIYKGFFSSTAVSGYDTVAYFTQNKAVEGSDDFKTKYKGATWKFSSAEHLKLFQENPEKYAPQYGGYCAWAIAHDNLVSSDPEQWHIQGGKLYLNYNADIKAQWLPRKDELISVADQKFLELLK